MDARSAVLIACVAALAAVSPARAQRVRGLLTDSATREPVGGAVVMLTDSAGGFLSRVLSGPDGAYNVPRLIRTQRMHIVRIGYRPYDAAIGAADSVVNVRLHPIASVLGAVSASSRRICPGDSTTGALELWEQARAGLLASVVSRETQPPTLRMRTYKRTYEPVRHHMLADSTDTKDVVVDKSFVAGRPAWAFASQGYVREGFNGEREYFAPDDAVMLDQTFAGTHCLHVIEGRGPRADELGIAFDPIKDAERDTIVDVTGVLWLARSDLALREVEFQYTHLERDARGSGGDIVFEQMPNKTAMITRWAIHAPILATDEEVTPTGVRRTPLPRPMRGNVRLLGFRETGGTVGFVHWPSGMEWHSADLPRAVGTVVDLKGAPVAGAVVWMAGTRDTVRSAADGTFHFPYVFPGIYAVFASDTVLAMEGVSRTVVSRVALFAPGEQEVTLHYHPRSEVLPLVCPANSYKPGTGVLMARVFTSNGEPAANARIEVEVQRILVAGDTIVQPQIRRGEAGEDGKFVICGAMRDRPMIVRAYKEKESAGVAVDEWKEEIATVSLVLRPTAP